MSTVETISQQCRPNRNSERHRYTTFQDGFDWNAYAKGSTERACYSCSPQQEAAEIGIIICQCYYTSVVAGIDSVLP
jgi:hypothetical protein